MANRTGQLDKYSTQGWVVHMFDLDIEQVTAAPCAKACSVPGSSGFETEVLGLPGVGPTAEA